MIPIPVNIPWKLVWAGLIAAGILVIGVYVYGSGKAAGRAEIQAEWDRANEEIAAQVAAKEAEYREKEEANKRASEEIQNELENRLSDADSRARDLARRLRNYQVRPCPVQVPGATDSTAESDPAPGGAASDGEIGRAVEEVYAACSRDSERLKGWQEWWSKVR